MGDVAVKMVEPIAVVDCFATGLGAVEILKGGNCRFVMYVEQTGIDGPENVIVQKIVMPVCSVPDAIALAWAATSGAIVRTVQGFLPNFH